MSYKQNVMKVAGIVTMVFLGGAGMVFAWTAPTGSAPAGNVAAPINIGPVSQTKNGNLVLNGYLASNGLTVTGGGNILLTGTGGNYLNFDTNINSPTAGNTGYGIMADGSGVLYAKNKGGTWTQIIAAGATTWASITGKPYPVNGQIWNYAAGQGVQPTWLWGTNDGNNMYVWNPSNFSVNYANSAGNANTTDGYSFNQWVTYGASPTFNYTYTNVLCLSGNCRSSWAGVTWGGQFTVGLNGNSLSCPWGSVMIGFTWIQWNGMWPNGATCQYLS